MSLKLQPIVPVGGLQAYLWILFEFFSHNFTIYFISRAEKVYSILRQEYALSRRKKPRLIHSTNKIQVVLLNLTFGESRQE